MGNKHKANDRRNKCSRQEKTDRLLCFIKKLLTMDFQTEITLLPRLLVALVLGVLIGLDREIDGNAAGIRTYAAVCLGAALITIINSHIDVADQTRIVANIVSGIGVLGAGTIWATAAVGIAIGFGMYPIGSITALLLILLLVSHHFPLWKKRNKNH